MPVETKIVYSGSWNLANSNLWIVDTMLMDAYRRHGLCFCCIFQCRHSLIKTTLLPHGVQISNLRLRCIISLLTEFINKKAETQWLCNAYKNWLCTHDYKLLRSSIHDQLSCAASKCMLCCYMLKTHLTLLQQQCMHTTRQDVALWALTGHSIITKTYTHTLTHAHTHSYTHAHTHTHTLTHSHTLSHTYTLEHSMSCCTKMRPRWVPVILSP